MLNRDDVRQAENHAKRRDASGRLRAIREADDAWIRSRAHRARFTGIREIPGPDGDPLQCSMFTVGVEGEELAVVWLDECYIVRRVKTPPSDTPEGG